MAVVKNLASVMTTADITSSATSIPVNRTNVFGAAQNPLDNPFYVTIMPASGSEPANLTNSEIALVTGISGTNLIVTRGQRSTTARAFTAGAIVTNGIYAEDAVLLGEAGTAVNPSPWVDTSEIVNGAITADKIATKAVAKNKMDWSEYGIFARDLDGGSQSYTANNATACLLPNEITECKGCTYSNGVITITQPGVWLLTGGARASYSGSSAYNGTLRLRHRTLAYNISVATGTNYANSSTIGTYNANVVWVGWLYAGDEVCLEIQSTVAFTNNTARQQHFEGVCLWPYVA